MPFDHKIQRSAAGLLFMAVPLMLAACSSDFGPTPMPTGYKYLNGQSRVSAGQPVMHQYPGQNGPVAPPMPAAVMDGPLAMTPPAAGPVTASTLDAPAALDKPEAPPPMAAQAGPQWHMAASSLLDKTEKDFGQLKDPVFLRQLPGALPGSPEFGRALNDELMKRKYKVTNDDKAPFEIQYGVKGQPEANHALLALIVNAQGRQVSAKEELFSIAGPPDQEAAPVQPPGKPLSPARADVQQPVSAIKNASTDPVVSTPAPAPVSEQAPAAAQPEQKIYVYDNRSGMATVPAEPSVIDERSHKTAYEERMGNDGGSVSSENDKAVQ